MSDTAKPKKGIPGPVAAIVVIVMVWLGAQSSDFFSGDEKPDEGHTTDSSPQETVIQESEKIPKPTEPEITLEEAPYQPAGNEWSTYHGGTALTGVVDVALPDAPEVLWRYQAESGVVHPPVADEDHLYFSTLKGQVISLDLSGEERWVKKFIQEPFRDGRERPERFDAPMAIFQEHIFVGSMSGILYSFIAASGDTAWTYDVGGPVMGSVNYDLSESGQGRVFIIEQGEGSLHSLNINTGDVMWQSEGVERCDGSPSVKDGQVVFGSCASALHVFDVSKGSLLKNIEFDADSQVAGGVAIVGHSAYSGSHSGRVFRVDLRNGKTLWINEDSMDEVFTTPAVNADRVIVASFDEHIYALDKATGKKVWSFNTGGIPTSPIISQDKVLVSSDGILFMLSLETGEVIWSYEVSDEISAPAIIDGMIVVGSEDGTVTAFGTKTP